MLVKRSRLSSIWKNGVRKNGPNLLNAAKPQPMNWFPSFLSLSAQRIEWGNAWTPILVLSPRMGLKTRVSKSNHKKFRTNRSLENVWNKFSCSYSGLKESVFKHKQKCQISFAVLPCVHTTTATLQYKFNIQYKHHLWAYIFQQHTAGPHSRYFRCKLNVDYFQNTLICPYTV